MPLTRYQIRNEFSLADPEVYKTADRDDPEALLEGVAMAGLVGVLRQLGDLAEFAAEIFHDLHEEVMATAARGHGLMVRVQQLEVEFPSIEKAFLSQTNHSSFYTSTGVEWQPNLRMEQNLITHGDLPRCVMDSYEECRGPPRLFLLDKFDVAGAGACLKRYTDPSFLKLEAAVGVQREKKIRKLKKKGSRWRNCESPELVSTSHAKLHQLFLEEKVEKGHSNPARLVKLKKRQLNASLLDAKSRKSYMEKFLETSEHNVVNETSSSPLALKPTSDNSSESGLEIHDISTVSPVKKSTQGKENTRNSQEVVRKPSLDELYGDAIYRQIVKTSELSADDKTEAISSVPQKVMIEKEIAVDREGKMNGSVDGDTSDDINSEVDNYMDALTTMESEMETDNDNRPKTGMGFWNVEKRGMDSGKTEERLNFQAHFSDNQSIGNFSASDDGNSSFKKGRFSFSNSDALSNLAENTLSDGEGSAKLFPSSKAFAAEIVETPSSHDLMLSNDTSVDEDNICDLGDAASSSCLVNSKPSLLQFDPAASSQLHKLGETLSECTKPGSESSYAEECETYLVDSSAAVSDMSSQTRDGVVSTFCAESHPVDNLDGGDPDVSSDSVLHSSYNAGLAYEEKSSNDSADDSCPEKLVNIRVDSPKSVNSPREEQDTLSTMQEVELCSDSASWPASSNVVKPDDLVSEVNDAFPESGASPEASTSMADAPQDSSSKEQQASNIEYNTPSIEINSTEKAALYSEESNLEDICSTANTEKVGVLSCEADYIKGDEVLKLPSKWTDSSALEDDDGLEDVVAESVQAEYMVALYSEESNLEDICSTANTENVGVLSCEADYIKGDEVLKLPSKWTDSSALEDDDGLEDVVAESVQAEYMVAPTVTVDDVPTTTSAHDNVDNIVFLQQDSICSPFSNLENLPESPFGTEDPGQKGLEFNEPISPACVEGSEAEKEMNQLDVEPEAFDSTSCKLASDDDSYLKVIDDGSSLADCTQNRMLEGDAIIAQASSALHDQDLECLHQNNLQEDAECATSSPADHLSDPEIFQQSPALQADQFDVELSKEEEASFISLQHLSEVIHSSNLTDHERLFNDASESCQEELPNKSSPSEDLAQSTCQEINSVEQTMDPSGSVSPSSGLLHEANQVNMEELPPLPPLPPMQWRLGKILDAPLISLQESIGHSNKAFPLVLPFKDDEKAQFDFPDQQRGLVLSGNPFLPLTAGAVELHVSEHEVGDTGQPTISMQMSSKINDENNEQNSVALEGNHFLNPFLTSAALPIEEREHGVLASGGQVVHASSKAFLSEPAGTHTASDNEPVFSQGKLIHSHNQLIPDTVLEHNTLQSTSQNSEVGHDNSSCTLVLPLRKVEEQPQHCLPTSEGESAWPSNPFVLLPTSEVENPNGSSVVKLPRPRNPLIDDVVALDKSKLRKVTERVRTQNGPKLDERDSLLEQIRTKSFNLKPAVLSRPSIQFPKTNLKVAAILEKANAIRQATAGSDEDDDDSWSDS
ncbi:protein SCAR2-like isoform X2 [Mangifera indica]|uniref:protein SCAR2-like isoform X2 n=1 Tax=Mangifera indica TaxID=29780 RepID=UPI001CFC34E8|nr:protein SCAR2-like isoform X2 [Mangifera indica]XP_044481171.1 protein SCAR2-like isoform X2 [Mangifera indica]